MKQIIFERARTAGVLSFLVMSLAACGSSPDAAAEQPAGNTTDPVAPAPSVVTTTATPSPIETTAPAETPAVTRPSPMETETRPEPVPAKTSSSTRRGSQRTPSTAPAPVPTSTSSPATDPHAGHDMSTMSDEEMKAMGHD